MSFLLNPYAYETNIVTNGLVLNLDASNPLSYPGSGSTWFDISGNGRNYSISGNASWNSSGYFNVSSGGAAFVGPASNSFGFAQEHYVEAVIFPTASPDSIFFNWRGTPSVGSDTRAIQTHLPFGVNRTLIYDVHGCCAATQRISVEFQVPLNTIKHYSVITRTSAIPNRQAYRNAVSIVDSGSNSTASVTWNRTESAFLCQTWQGRIYSLRAYSRALTNDEILKNYNYDAFRFGIT